MDKNEPFYIGIGKDEVRAFSNKSRNRYWRFIVGITDYEVDILLSDITWEEAQEKEKELIALYGRKDLNKGTLVNMTDGGDGTLGQKPNSTSFKKGKSPNETCFKKGSLPWNTGLKGTYKLGPSPCKGRTYIRAKLECPHCGLLGGISGMKRWHFDSCPHKGNS